MAETHPIRKSSEGFPGDEALYLERLTQVTLPEELEPLRHTLDWPVDMGNPHAHISCFFGQPNYSGSVDNTSHFALDIQVPLGSTVVAPETSTFVYRDADTYANNRRGLADVLLYSQKSGFAYWLVHLDSTTLHPTIAKRHWFDRDSDEVFQKKEQIGQVGLFFNNWAVEELRRKGKPGELHQGVNIPTDVEAIYGRSYNHLHFEIHYLPNPYRLGVDARNPIDPLALLKRLY